MAHTINIEDVAPREVGTKGYSVNIKGLVKHFLDVLFVSKRSSRDYNVSDLSAHMLKDIGIDR
ncbi:DUF1127 domain-containing protein [Vibrio profundum]|uniref:hypothetical protein n=1 Tax=Vibrio profundum TaxID=2910247 RepID=UPI003D0C7573